MKKRIIQEQKKLENLSIEEMREIARIVDQAEGMGTGHWFKCPNGHFYCIADCGNFLTQNVYTSF